MVIKEAGRRARTKAASRARIIDSAIRLFGERGIDEVTVDEIAALADVGKGTIYNYFRTKEDIVVAFMADVEQKVQAKLRELDTAKRPLTTVLTEFITLQFEMKAPHHRFVRVFLAQMFARTEQFLPHMAEIHELQRSTTASLFEALRKRRAIRGDVSIEDLTLVFNTMHLGLTALWAIEGPPFYGTNHVLQREIALFCEGLEGKKR